MFGTASTPKLPCDEVPKGEEANNCSPICNTRQPEPPVRNRHWQGNQSSDAEQCSDQRNGGMMLLADNGPPEENDVCKADVESQSNQQHSGYPPHRRHQSKRRTSTLNR
jgi:hypothetical protein